VQLAHVQRNKCIFTAHENSTCARARYCPVECCTTSTCAWLTSASTDTVARSARPHTPVRQALADVLADATYIMGDPGDDNALCTFQAALQQFAQVAMMLWSAAVAHTLRAIAVTEKAVARRDERATLLRFHAFVWGGAAVCTVLPATTQSYGEQVGLDAVVTAD
jgi:hypothetical protein